ncbi:hypothetical protein NHX12_001475 [Muraenolepis orangiensis]|uniref:MANSC domain-containing protein n=1 Tax=Muraenolepis orangiensis TaxID=630683 RepID=A0A9Q0DZS0_9TELE|nr:hypothetical protein NHX12_001475 [Muraenolepis orangiensis]
MRGHVCASSPPPPSVIPFCARSGLACQQHPARYSGPASPACTAVRSQCHQGATFSEAVLSPELSSSSILWVPGVTSLAHCLVSCCDLPRCDLAWLFQRRCYILICHQGETCRPQERPGADSYLAFVRRGPPQTLVLGSLVRGEPYGERWKSSSEVSEAPGDVEALRDLAVLEGEEGPRDKGEGGGDLETGLLSHWPEEETVRQRPHAVVEPPNQVLSSPVRDVVLNASHSQVDGLLSCEWEQISGPPVHLGRSADTWSLYLAHLETGNYTFRVTVSDSAGSSDSTTATILVVPPDAIQVPVSVAREEALNGSPVAVVGPDRMLVLPVSGVTLDGRESRDDQVVVHYHWDAASGPPGLKMEGVDRAVATVTGLRVGRYTFRLTVSDQQGATDSAVLTVRVEDARVLPPVAHASGSHNLTLPNNSLVLRGSVTDGDQTQVHFLWVRDSQSPAAGDVLYSSQTQASLYLSNLVEGTYLGGPASPRQPWRSAQVSVAQRDTVIRQLAALLHVLDNNIQLRILPGHSHLSAVLRLSVRGPEGPLPGSQLVQVLRSQLLREKTDYLLFRVLRVDTVFCLLQCSGRGQCDPITKECVCDPFWTENLVRRFLGDRERNCEWRVLYVVMSSFMALVLILMISWSLVCCCRKRKRSKVRKKTKYTILDDMDDQERVELRPKHGSNLPRPPTSVQRPGKTWTGVIGGFSRSDTNHCDLRPVDQHDPNDVMNTRLYTSNTAVFCKRRAGREVT